MIRDGIIRRRIYLNIRLIARASFIEANGDKDRAIELATEKIRDQYGSILVTILLGVLIRLAVDLIYWWLENNMSLPPIDPMTGEPTLDAILDKNGIDYA